MSSFRKFSKPSSITNSSNAESIINSESVGIQGAKPWMNNTHLVSTGNRELDEIFNGGLPLSSILIINNDQYSNYGMTFTYYSLAEAISYANESLVITSTINEGIELLNNLPYNQNYKQQESTSTINSESSSEQQNSESNKSEEKESIDNLKIAWQYKKYFQNRNLIINSLT